MILFLLSNLTGVFVGAFLLVVLQPQTDFFYLLPGFMLLGVFAANLLLAFIIELAKPLDKTRKEAEKQTC